MVLWRASHNCSHDTQPMPHAPWARLRLSRICSISFHPQVSLGHGYYKPASWQGKLKQGSLCMVGEPATEWHPHSGPHWGGQCLLCFPVVLSLPSLSPSLYCSGLHLLHRAGGMLIPQCTWCLEWNMAPISERCWGREHRKIEGIAEVCRPQHHTER